MKSKISVENIKPTRLKKLRNSHERSCACAVCCRIDTLYDGLKESFSEEKLQGGSSGCRCQIWEKECSKSPTESSNEDTAVKDFDQVHDAECDCVYCNLYQNIIEHFKKDSVLEDDESGTCGENENIPIVGSEMVKEELETFIICDPRRPLVLRAKDGVVYSTLDVNTGEVKTSNEEDQGAVEAGKVETDADVTNESMKEVAVVKAKRIYPDEVIDKCLCPPGKLSPVCLKHSVAYSKDMSVRLIAEGCTCNELTECSLCEKMNCIDCRHELEDFMCCPTMISEDSFNLENRVSSWLDVKLKENGLDHLWKDSEESRGSVEEEASSELLLEQLTQSLKTNILDRWESLPPHPDFELSESMKQEIINVNEMFDVRPWPRCYRLKGKKNSKGEVDEIEEELNDFALEMWKHPTQFPEDTFPLGLNTPDPESQMERESEIRLKMADRIKKGGETGARGPRAQVVGLGQDWKPIVAPLEKGISDEGSDAIWSKQSKRDACEGMISDVDNHCRGLWEEDEVVPCYNDVQKVLDKYCEESIDWKGVTAEDVEFLDFDEYIEKEYKSVKDWLKGNTGNGVGYKEEFWKGLENWKPDAKENQVRKTFLVELDRFLKQMEPLMSASGESISDRERTALLDKLFSSLPQHKKVLETIRSKMSKEAFTVEGLVRLESEVFSGMLNRPAIIDSDPKGQEIEKTEKDYEEVDYTFDDDGRDESDAAVLKRLKKVDKYDDEEDEDIENIVSEVNEKWIKETEELIESVENPENASKIQEDMKNRLTKVLNVEPSPSPFCEQMAEEMKRINPKGLSPAQKFWAKEPSFPFWTPTTIYNFEETEKLIFGSNEYPETESDYDEANLSDIEKEIFKESRYEDEAVSDSDGEIDVPEEAPVPVEEVEPVKEEIFEQPLNLNLRQQSSKISLNLDQLMKGVAGKVESKPSLSYAIQLDSRSTVNYNAIVPSPAHSWPFQLDTFQKQSIIALEAGLNVFVLAHTSAGKTVTAEYAIGMADRMGSKIVYTSPIKALSNQKFKDFKDTFKDRISVGIITGDIQLNEEAQCLIMTTEILRSMLINNSNLLHDLQFVIFDEVHYFNDPERGNVWEEVFIRLPSSCQLVMLSATVLDPMEFASWIGKLKKKTVVVTSTPHRPVPLNHYIHVGVTKESIPISHLIKKAEGRFINESFEEAMELKAVVDKIKKRHVLPTQWVNFVQNHLKAKKRLPAVVFSLSRKTCDKLANHLKVVDLTTDVEKEIIEEFIKKSISKLEEHDKKIHQIVTLRSLLIRGIGVHHSGILPILKEIVECLFQNGQVKLLFATETFAMGVNMPAKTVVFDSIRKFDGDEWRTLTTAEYTQMAGRAGRRGKDKSGTVIILDWFLMNKDPVMEKQRKLIQMLTGSVQSLESQFKLRYSLILDMQQPRGDVDMESLMSNSYRNQSSKKRDFLSKITMLNQSSKDIYEKVKLIPALYMEIFRNYYDIANECLKLFKEVRLNVLSTLQKYLKPGRVIVICHKHYMFVYGIILNVNNSPSDPSKTVYEVLTLKEFRPAVPSIKEQFPFATEDQVFKWHWMVMAKGADLGLQRSNFRGLELLQINGINIHKVTTVECPVHSSILKILKSPPHVLAKSQDQLKDVIHGFDIVLRTSQIMFFENTRCNRDPKLTRFLELENEMRNINFFPPRPDLLQMFELFFWWKELTEQEKTLTKNMEDETSALKLEYESKLCLLKEHGFLDKNNLLTLKGNIARRINNYEVFVTELLFTNIFQKLDAAETAALLSCLVSQGKLKKEETTDIPKDFNAPIDLNMHFQHGTKGKRLNQALKTAESEAMGALKQDQERTKKAKQPQIKDNLQKAIQVAESLKDKLIQEEIIMGVQDSDLQRLSFDMVPIMYDWANGMKFESVMTGMREMGLHNIQEGILVRWIQQLIETIRGIESASRLMGDPEVICKLQGAVVSLKRGIVFTPSLYLD